MLNKELSAMNLEH